LGIFPNPDWWGASLPYTPSKTQGGAIVVTKEVILSLSTFRVAGVVKVTDAGLEMRFETFDPALAPQPVLLKAGGGARVLLVNIARSFEATRTDFKQVVPFDEAAVPVR